MATHMDIPWKDRRIKELEDRVRELEDAIRLHRDEFADQPMQEEYHLWSHVMEE